MKTYTVPTPVEPILSIHFDSNSPKYLVAVALLTSQTVCTTELDMLPFSWIYRMMFLNPSFKPSSVSPFQWFFPKQMQVSMETFSKLCRIVKFNDHHSSILNDSLILECFANISFYINFLSFFTKKNASTVLSTKVNPPFSAIHVY